MFSEQIYPKCLFFEWIVVESVQVDRSLLNLSFGHKMNGWVI